MHPTIYLATEITLTVLILSFTAPSSPLRPAGFLATALCATRCIPHCMPYMIRTPWAACVGGYAVTYVYHYLDVALLSRWSFEHGGRPVGGLLRPTTSTKYRNTSRENEDTTRARLLFGIKMACSFRFVGTVYEVRNTPPAPTATTQRKAFLRRAFVTILVSYVTLDVLAANSADRELSSRFLTADKIPVLARWRDVTAAELGIRCAAVLAAGLSLLSFQNGVYHTCALVCVAARLSEPEEWRAWNGAVGEAYTLGRFWGIFWHQTNSRKFSSIANHATHNLLPLRLTRGTKLARYIRILLAFASSGVMHLFIDLASGISFHDSGAMRFFLTQAFGIVLEDCVVRAYQRLPARVKLSKWVGKVLGGVWVAGFLAWSVPGYVYPMLWRVQLGLDDAAVPFSFFGAGDQRVKAICGLMSVGVVALVG